MSIWRIWAYEFHQSKTENLGWRENWASAFFLKICGLRNFNALIYFFGNAQVQNFNTAMHGVPCLGHSPWDIRGGVKVLKQNKAAAEEPFSKETHPLRTYTAHQCNDRSWKKFAWGINADLDIILILEWKPINRAILCALCTHTPAFYQNLSRLYLRKSFSVFSLSRSSAIY